MTDKISNYSTTPGSNNAASPDGWPEGMAPSGLNNSDREFAARVREWYEDPAWIDYGDTIVSSTSTTVSISGDVTGQYIVGRAIRAGQSESYVGYVTAAAYSAPNTSITASGLDLTAVTQIELGGVKRSNQLPNTYMAKVRATNGTNQTIAAASTTVMAYGTEVYDTEGIYDASGYKLIATTATAGYYEFNALVTASITAGAAGYFYPLLTVAGSTYAQGDLLITDASDSKSNGSAGLNCTAYLAAGETATVMVYSGYAVTISTNGTAAANYLEARKLP